MLRQPEGTIPPRPCPGEVYPVCPQCRSWLIPYECTGGKVRKHVSYTGNSFKYGLCPYRGFIDLSHRVGGLSECLSTEGHLSILEENADVATSHYRERSVRRFFEGFMNLCAKIFRKQI